MTDRATGRHRAPARATTPLTSFGSTVTSSLSDHVTGISRSSAILAVSSGLVATMGIPSGAVIRDAPPVPLAAPAADADASLLGVPSSLGSGASVTAPATATLTFDGSSLRAVPKPQPTTPTVSRSSVRTSSGTTSTSTVTGGSFGSARGSSVIAVAARYVGVPYRSGGMTPSGFDCSGFTKYVFGQLGVSLPRTADQQYQATTRIPSSQARPGDLVFFHSGGTAYHVGIFAGDGMMYDAGKPGLNVTKRAIWSADISFGRP